jgi:tRNA threonylcarbamoyladenosine biosynthesis protein TsaE
MKKILEKKILNHQSTNLFVEKLFDKYLSKEENFTIFFKGGLGAGKTYIIRKILNHFGITEPVTSPTYIFVNEYTKNNGKRHFAHFDLYRLKNDEDFFSRGFDEIVENENISKFVEWPDKISSPVRHAFSGTTYFVNIKHGISAGLRTIKIYREK